MDFDKAYRNTVEIFPKLMRNFESYLNSRVMREDLSALFNKAYRDISVSVVYIYIEPEPLSLYFESCEGEDKGSKDVALLSFFGFVDNLVDFMVRQLSVSRDLYDYFDSYLTQDLGYGYDGWFYIECMNRFRKGLGMDVKLQRQLRISDQSVSETDYFHILYYWQQVGCFLREKPTSTQL